MTTVAQAFHGFIKDLELKPGEVKEVQDRYNDLYPRLQARFRNAQGLVSGSYGRSTAIRPLHDIDLFLVLPAGSDWADLAPAHCLRRVVGALGEEYKGQQEVKQPQIKGRSVNIVLGTVGFDVVPAFEVPGQKGVYKIPDRFADKWIHSNPWRHQEICNEKDKSAESMLRPLVKLIKHWNQRSGRPAPSFLLEVFAYGAFQGKPDSFSRGLSQLFDFASKRILEPPCPDPARVGPPIDQDLDTPHRTEAANRLRGAAGTAAEAVRMEDRGDHDGAINLWKKILGPDSGGN